LIRHGSALYQEALRRHPPMEDYFHFLAWMAQREDPRVGGTHEEEIKSSSINEMDVYLN
jgi:hypothetical protein